MGVSWRDINHFEFFTANAVFDYLPACDRSKPDNRIALNHKEFFRLRMVVMISPRRARFGPGKEYLPEMRLFYEFGKASSHIRLELLRIPELFSLHVAQIGRVKSPSEFVDKGRKF